MAVERTLAIVKPDAVGRGLTADIVSRVHAAKFKIIAIKSVRLTKKRARRIPRRLSPAQFAKSWAKASSLIARTVRTRRTLRRMRLVISFRALNWSELV
jgi:nucleoside diphosphate kinase